MTDTKPHIISLEAVALADNRRVRLEMAVEGLPPMFTIFTPDAEKPDSDTHSRYPNIELSILNRERQLITSMLIIEYKEPSKSFTLHLRSPDIQEKYTARAEMSYQKETVQVVETPFILNQDRN